MNNNKWDFKRHSYAIADTGDYDGYYELTNGEISLITKDDIDDLSIEDSYISVIVEALNQLGANWENWEQDNLNFEIHLLKQQIQQWKSIAAILYEDLKYGCNQDELSENLKAYEELLNNLP